MKIYVNKNGCCPSPLFSCSVYSRGKYEQNSLGRLVLPIGTERKNCYFDLHVLTMIIYDFGKKSTNLHRRASGWGVGPGELQDPIPCMSFTCYCLCSLLRSFSVNKVCDEETLHRSIVLGQASFSPLGIGNCTRKEDTLRHQPCR